MFAARTNRPQMGGPFMAGFPTLVTIVSSSIDGIGHLHPRKRTFKSCLPFKSSDSQILVPAASLKATGHQRGPGRPHNAWPLLLHLPLKRQTAPKCTWKGKVCIGANGGYCLNKYDTAYIIYIYMYILIVIKKITIIIYVYNYSFISYIYMHI